MDRASERPRWTLPDDLADPIALARRLEHRPGLVVLDGDGSSPRGRFSYVASDPIAVVTADAADDDPFAAFEELAIDAGAGSPVPRYIGFIAYDAAHASIDGARHERSRRAPVWFGRFDAVAVFDAEDGTAEIVGDDDAAIGRFRARLESIASDATHERAVSIGEVDADDADVHARSIESAIESIHRGDVYQVNLARRFVAPFRGSSLRFYEAMRAASPVPYGAFVKAGDRALLGRSMECFLELDARSRRLVTRPIKGTVGESVDRDADAARLRADPKEHAEHVMVVDLLRNDLGRVATIGTVRVEDAFVVEPFAKLSHLVSTIACALPESVGLPDLLRATFPPGSVTGTPKRAAMEIIEALEHHARGPYCGAYGAIFDDGSMRLAVAIRTAVVEDETLVYWAGGGIVAASVPAAEVAETELKARVLMDAVDACRR